mgnify:CR=1 FL=1
MNEVWKSILVVDDNEDIRNLLTLVLENEGYLVTQGVDGGECLEIIQDKPFDLILLDSKRIGYVYDHADLFAIQQLSQQVDLLL